MKDAFEFIKHTVLNRQFDETLTQIHGCGDFVQSFNGVVCANHPLEGIGEFSVTSTKLINAVNNCDWEPNIRKTEKNLIITKGKFRVVLPFNKEYTARTIPKKGYTTLPTGTVDAIRNMMPFLSDDASRAWSQSMLVQDGWLYVTNNVILVRCKTDLPDCCLPAPLLNVMSRIKKDPIKFGFGKKGIAVKYENGAWLSSLVSTEKWPDAKSLFKGVKFKKLDKIPEKFVKAVDMTSPFTDMDIMGVEEGALVTDEARVDQCGVDHDMRFSCTNMKIIVKIFTHADFSQYPKPMPLSCDGLQGLFVGMA